MLRGAKVWNLGAVGCTALAWAQDERVVVRATPKSDARGSIEVRVVSIADETLVAGIGVSVAPMTRGAEESRQGETDLDGVFRAEGVPVDAYALGVEWGQALQRHVSESQTSVQADGRVRVTMHVEAHVTVEGRVVDASGAPVAGAVISSVSPWQERWDAAGPYRLRPLAKTGADGRFRVDGLGRGARLCATAPGHAASTCVVVADARPHVRDVELRVGERGAEAHGRVLGENGEPIENAFVLVKPQDASAPDARSTTQTVATGAEALAAPRAWFVRTHADGSFRFDHLEPAKYVLAALAPGRTPMGGALDLAAGASRALKLALPRSATIRIAAVDESGKGIVRGLWVAVRRAPAAARVGLGGPETLAEGDPRSSWCFVGPREQPSPPSSPLRDGTWTTHFRNDGTFAIYDAPAGRVQFGVFGNDLGTVVRIVDLKPGEELQWDAVLPERVQLRGRLIDARGEPVAHAWVRVDKASGQTVASTDAAGRFVIERCPKRAMRIEAFEHGDFRSDETGLPTMNPRYADLTVTPPLDDELVIRVGDEALASASVQGQLIGSDGAPCGDAAVQLRWPIPEALVRTGTPEAARALLNELRAFSVGPKLGFVDRSNGRFTVGRVRPGRYEVWVVPQPESYLAFKALETELSAFEARDVGTLALPAFGQLLLTARGEDQRTVYDVEAEIRGANGDAIPVDGPLANVDPMPQRLRPGKYTVRASGPKQTRAEESFEIKAGEATRVELVLR